MSKKKDNTREVILIIIIAAIALFALIIVPIIAFGIYLTPVRSVTGESNFLACINAGYPIMETSPRQCRLPSGEIVIEKPSNEALSFIRIPSNIQEEQKIAYHIKSAEEFKETFGKETEIDFENYDMIAVFAGSKRSGGYSTQITRVMENEDSLKVYVQETSPGKNCIVTMALTYPSDIILIEKTNKSSIDFIYSYRLMDCS